MNDPIVLRSGTDNYMYILTSGDHALVIDPTEAAAVIEYLDHNGLSLKYVLNTHHHFDHVGGNHLLKKKTGACVLGTDSERTPACDRTFVPDEVLRFGSWNMTVLATPGHTPDGVSFLCAAEDGTEPMCLFCGDTLFRGGCGRVLGAYPRQLWDSLLRLSQLAEDTRVYPGHEYTVENYEFACSVDPENEIFEKQLAYVCALHKQGLPLVPSTIGEEKERNIFLQCAGERMRRIVGLSDASDADVFAHVRRMKDSF